MLHSISGTMSHNAYKNYKEEKGSATAALEQDYTIGIDPASGVFFNTDFRRHEDLKEMLDSNKDNLKLEAMKRIIGMIAKGRDASALFPAVVKNVVSKNVELKKLVYSYLERYAEEQEDLALLSISTFQRALKEPNQLIRAGALRVLSGIRVTMISPIVMIAIRDAAADMSPYVRKTAAHAIPKLYSLDIETKTELIVIIEKLLADRTVLVIGSAVMAFTKVCPERVDLIHKVYRKLCLLLGDVDEWGQVIIVNTLTRYARTQFTDPCSLIVQEDEKDPKFYESDSEASEKESSNTKNAAGPSIDTDHRLLLKSARPLLQSRNSAVVMAVAQMYHHIGPHNETIPAVKAIIRLLRSFPEVQELVLKTIVTMTVMRKGAFDSYIKSFFVRTTDSTRVKLLKLTILTNIANDQNISIILRELETYISSYDDDFVAATIQAIGRCACFINSVTDTCLTGLVTLLSNKNEVVVAESVVVIKRLLQTQAVNPKEIIEQMIRLLDNIEVPQARASIIWLLGEHSNDILTASNVLKKAAKSFAQEEDTVKLQVLNLSVKLYISNKEEYELLCQYIFNLAKYDQNYDVRDRSRLLRTFIENPENMIVAQAAEIFLAAKPAPIYRTTEDSEQFQLGSLSHSINAKAAGYEPLPTWPTIAPPCDVRDVEVIIPAIPDKAHEKKRKEDASFAWDSEASDAYFSDDKEIDGSSSETESDDSTTDDELDEQSSSCVSSEAETDNDSSTQEDTTQSSSEESGTETEVVIEKPKQPKLNHIKKPQAETIVVKTNLDLLLDFEVNDADDDQSAPILTPSLGGFLSPIANNEHAVPHINEIQSISPNYIPKTSHEILNRINGKGLSISFRFTRNPHLFSTNMVNINLVFTNTNADEITDIKLGHKNISSEMSVHEFACITTLNPSSSLPGTLGIDFNDSLQSANLEIDSSIGSFNVCVKPSVGEIIRPVIMAEDVFVREQTKLKGMNEHSGKMHISEENVLEKVYQCGNLGFCASQVSDNLIRFAAQTLTSSSLVLVTIATQKDDESTITVNCEKMVIASMLLKEIKAALSKSSS